MHSLAHYSSDDKQKSSLVTQEVDSSTETLSNMVWREKNQWTELLKFMSGKGILDHVTRNQVESNGSKSNINR